MTNVKKPAIANSSVIPSGGNSGVIASCVPKNKQDNGRLLTNFPSDSVRDQFDKVHSGSYSVPTSPKIHELRTRHEEFHAKIASQMEKQTDRG